MPVSRKTGHTAELSVVPIDFEDERLTPSCHREGNGLPATRRISFGNPKCWHPCRAPDKTSLCPAACRLPIFAYRGPVFPNLDTALQMSAVPG